MHGHGIYTYNSGVKYVGKFCTDKMHGEGVLHFLNGTMYRGLWVNGEAVKGSRGESPTDRSSEGQGLSRCRSAFSVTDPQRVDGYEFGDQEFKSPHTTLEKARSELSPFPVRPKVN